MKASFSKLLYQLLQDCMGSGKISPASNTRLRDSQFSCVVIFITFLCSTGCLEIVSHAGLSKTSFLLGNIFILHPRTTNKNIYSFVSIKRGFHMAARTCRERIVTLVSN